MKKALLTATLLISTFVNTLAVDTVLTNHGDPNKIDPWLFNPLSRYLTKEQFKQIAEESARPVSNRSDYMEGKVITINTQDKEACQQVRKELKLGAEVCLQDKNNPLVSVVVMRDSSEHDFEKEIRFSELSEKEKTVVKEVRNLGIMGAGMFGIIYALPESISKWDKSRGFLALASKYDENIKAGPVIDKDDWVVNYIGHPVSGAAYYTMVRHQGFSRMESFAFSVAMSTFFWEYGIEAFAEIPSLQDLIITPVIGSLMGEAFYQAQLKIDANGGKLLGSKALGTTASVLMNPAGALSKKINKLFDGNVVKDASFSFTTKNPIKDDFLGPAPAKKDGYMGIQLKLIF